jgi:hypothetical protein
MTSYASILYYLYIPNSKYSNTNIVSLTNAFFIQKEQESSQVTLVELNILHECGAWSHGIMLTCEFILSNPCIDKKEALGVSSERFILLLVLFITNIDWIQWS